MRRSRLIAFAFLTAAVLAAPGSAAHASGGGVDVSYVSQVVDENGVHHVVAECDATAMPNGSGDLAATTTVTCTINGTNSTEFYTGTSATAPGSKAVFFAEADVSGRAELCVSGTVTYLDFMSNEPYTVSSEHPVCTVVAT